MLIKKGEPRISEWGFTRFPREATYAGFKKNQAGPKFAGNSPV